MWALIEQNKQQAREILIQNPLLTKALFQIPNIQPAAASQQPQQSAQPQPPQQPNIQAAHSLPGQVGLPDQIGASQAQSTMRKQLQSQPTLPASSATPPVNLQSQPIPSHPLQMPHHSKVNLNPQPTPMTVPQPSQLPSMPQPPIISSQPLPHQQHQMPASAQLQQPLQTTGMSHMPLQPPLPPQARPHSMPSYHHQYGQQMGPNMGFQHTGAPQHPSQPMFHVASINLAWDLRFSKDSLLSPGGSSNLGSDFNNQMGSSMQVDRGSPWMSGPQDSSTMSQLPGGPGPSPLAPSQMGTGNQQGRSAAVMSLTPDQINLLPPEQRNQVLQLQQMLRQ
ncbi:hypothetical protein Tsubulata_048970 [Turnera subulata]|uniref:Transcription termination and cleavage factor C-terminal domain-containing protein n=1 Tax=Turnera subulata TaxID=218843 RepID=A0A9Q0J6I8_9ROSI|nr:hypothetical protein Tsubulata_048970 [Turnera subulata]